MSDVEVFSDVEEPEVQELTLPQDASSEKERFVTELEFVQCLANPHYLNFLSVQGFLADQAFLKYLNYLQYWLQPKYAKYIKFSQCLHFLKLLQEPEFRLYISNPSNADNILSQQDRFWFTYWKNRLDTTIPDPKFVSLFPDNEVS